MAAQQKTEGDGASEYILLRVVGQDSKEIHFRVKMEMRLVKLKLLYSKRVGAPVTSLRFIFDGKRINDEETPNQLEMQEGDMVEVFQEQIGGHDINKTL